MAEVKEAIHENFHPNIDTNEQKSPLGQEKQYREDEEENKVNPEVELNAKLHPKLEHRNSSKLLMKQRDRFENNAISKNMFNYAEDSVDELKIVYNNSISLQNSDSVNNIKSRKSMKLMPLESLLKNKSVKVIDENDIHKNSFMNRKAVSKNTGVFPILIRQISNLSLFVREALPKNKKFVGILKRITSGSKYLYPEFEVYLNQQMKFILSSKKQSLKLFSTYAMSSSFENVSSNDEKYAGTLVSNLLGSEFNLYDIHEDGQTQMLATIVYPNTLNCNQNPREIHVYMLSPFFRYFDCVGSDPNMRMSLKELYEIGENKQNKQNKKIIRIVSKKPIWNPETNRFCMNFYGKAKMSSIKNTIMVIDDDEQREVMLLAKIDQNDFNLQISYPLSPRLALAIASSSFDFKWVSQ